jgi:hypothetical protein
MLDTAQLEAIRDGREVPEDLASIVIPHYRTPDLARLCLRAIRRLTDHPYEVIVVDNHSDDGSVDALGEIAWIRLIARGSETEAEAVYAHASAMDLGTREARGRWLVSLHTDTIVRREGWLGDLLGRLKAAPNAAALGSGKLDTDPGWYRAMKRLWDTHRMKAALRRLCRLPPDPSLAPAPWYPRSYCAVYDLEKVRDLGLSWQPAPGHPTGDLLYRGLVEAGCDAVRLPPEEMQQYVEHVAHATALLGRDGLGHWRGNAKVRRALGRVMGSDLARQLLANDSLDR